jgi:hypothetical protein
MPRKVAEVAGIPVGGSVCQIEVDQQAREVAIIRQAQRGRDKQLPAHDAEYGDADSSLQIKNAADSTHQLWSLPFDRSPF